MGSHESKPEPEIETLHRQNIALIQKEISLFKENEMHIDKINVLIMGISGVGKSTFLNSFFGEKKAASGILRPATTAIEPYANDLCPLRIYDTPGIELDAKKQEELMKQIFKLIIDKKHTNDYRQYIHLIFYCVNTESRRIGYKEEKFIEALTNNRCLDSIPVIMVLTQSYDQILTKDLLKQIQELKIPNIRSVVPIVTEKREMSISGHTIVSEVSGKNEIKRAINECLPDKLKASIHDFQTSEIFHKRWRAIGFINKSTIETIENFSNLRHSYDWK